MAHKDRKPDKKVRDEKKAKQEIEGQHQDGLGKFPFSYWAKVFSDHPKRFAFLLLCLVAILLYINSTHNEFVFDDISLIQNNRRIESLSNIPKILGIAGRYTYRPIRELSYVIDYQFTGLNPAGYHWFNILYHVLSSFFIFLIASRVSKNRKVGLAAALLFVAHPIQTESVAYISGRRDILTALFYFVGFYFFLKHRDTPSRKYPVIISLSFILSFSSKEMGVTLPAVCFVYDLIQAYRSRTGKEAGALGWSHLLWAVREVIKKHWTFYLPFFLMACFFTFHKVFIRNPSRQEGFYGGTMASNFLTVIGIWIFYVKQMFLPLSLNAAHSFPLARSPFELRTAFSILILLAILFLLVKGLRKKALYSFCGFWFFITLLPVSHIFPHHELLAEHYLYLPSFGFVMAAGLLFGDLSMKGRGRSAVYLSLAALLLFYSARTIHRNLDWRNGLTLWSDTVEKSPDNLRAKLNLVAAYHRHGHYNEALSSSLDLLKSAPDDPEVYNNLGVSHMLLGRYDEAIDAFRKSIALRKNNPKIYNNLGVIYLQKGDLEEAITHFRQAILYSPTHADAYNNLAKALALKGLIDEAISEEKQAIRLVPTVAEYRFNLARLFEKKGWNDEALKEYKEALKLNPNLFEARYQLGELYTKTDRNKEAIEAFQKALTLNPTSGKTYFMLGVNFLKIRDREKAISSFEKALQYVTDEANRRRIQSALERLR